MPKRSAARYGTVVTLSDRVDLDENVSNLDQHLANTKEEHK
jgi:hypothetical protein